MPQVLDDNVRRLDTLIDDASALYEAANTMAGIMPDMEKLQQELKMIQDAPVGNMPHYHGADLDAIRGFERKLKDTANAIRWFTERY